MSKAEQDRENMLSVLSSTPRTRVDLMTELMTNPPESGHGGYARLYAALASLTADGTVTREVIGRTKRGKPIDGFRLTAARPA